MRVVECVGLSKNYSSVRAIDSLNIQLEGGRIIGLLGPNGCGKTTFMKLLTGLLSPTEGEIYICGYPRCQDTNSFISYLPERTYLNSRMTVGSMLGFFTDFYPDFDIAKAREMLRAVGVEESRRISTLSKGNREKVQLVLVMSRRAKLYLLDEPIAGVDPAARENILRTIVGNYNENAATIITTHLIADVEQVIDEFVFMAQGGRILRRGMADDVREETGQTIDQLFREVFRYA